MSYSNLHNLIIILAIFFIKNKTEPKCKLNRFFIEIGKC